MKSKIFLDPDIHFKVLNTIKNDPSITQRELSTKLGVSLGAVNFCIQALIKKGHIKTRNFKNSSDKAAYFYVLTPKGIQKKASLINGFLKRKINEYHQLKKEINLIKLELNQKDLYDFK